MSTFESVEIVKQPEKVSESDAQKCINEIEEIAINDVKNLGKKCKQNEVFIMEELERIMIKGENKFKEKMGRNMTYSEIRQAFG
jgi:hypothetical protein